MNQTLLGGIISQSGYSGHTLSSLRQHELSLKGGGPFRASLGRASAYPKRAISADKTHPPTRIVCAFILFNLILFYLCTLDIRFAVSDIR
jgi:hypothetical protein